jgi:hypothetical protein
MKTKKIQQIVAIAGFIPTFAFSQYETAQNVTFALTVSETVDALVARDSEGKPELVEGKTYLRYENSFSTTRGAITTSTVEKGTKVMTMKISNKDILEAFMGAGIILDIKGYSISFYSGGDANDAFHLVKAGSPAINVSEYLFFVEEEAASAENFTERTISTEYDDPEKDSKESYTRNGNGKTIVKLRFQISNDESSVDAYLSGIASWSETYRVFGKGDDQYGLIVPGAASMNNIVGEDKGDDSTLIEVRISMTAGSLIPAPVSPR